MARTRWMIPFWRVTRPTKSTYGCCGSMPYRSSAVVWLVGADWVSHEADVAAERRPQALQHRVGGVDGVRGLIRANPPAILVRRRSGEAAHLDLDELAQLAGQVVDVDPSAAVHVGRELIGEDQGPHRRLA